MNMDNKSSETAITPVIKKEPYVKPSFRYEKVLETNALSCGKTPNSSMQCNLNQKNS
jgi:hypothetical protein